MTDTTTPQEPLDPNQFSELDEFSSPAASLIDTEFITGAAGTGKTTLIRQRIADADDPDSIVLSATTGIAAVNMGEGVTTIHSLLGFFNYPSLQDSYINGRIQRKLKTLAKDGVREVVIDEVSMMSGPTLDILYNAFNEVAGDPECKIPVKLTLTGDACQLSPIPEKNDAGKNLPIQWFFDAAAWPHFSSNTTRLTKIWRQSDPTFLESLQALRCGDGATALAGLQKLGVVFAKEIEDGFEGTTLRAKNEDVARYNQMRLIALEGKAYGAKSSRWGIKKIYDPALNRQPSDWDKILPMFQFKVGALVIIKANSLPAFDYVNGDLGIIRGMEDNLFHVELLRNGRTVEIGKIIRRIEVKSLPEEFEGKKDKPDNVAKDQEEAQRTGLPYQREVSRGKYKWVLGEIEYYPLKLGYAQTIHSSQGLSLTKVQIDMRSHFFSAPAMAYVSLSRCRTPEGLRLVGDPHLLVERCNVHERVKDWL